jgi:hypothetical protein
MSVQQVQVRCPSGQASWFYQTQGVALGYLIVPRCGIGFASNTEPRFDLPTMAPAQNVSVKNQITLIS